MSLGGTDDIACSRLRDSGEKSFSKKKCEKRAGAHIFALLVLILRTILSKSLAQATDDTTAMANSKVGELIRMNSKRLSH